METKICSICKKEKPIDEFGKNNQILSGIHYECKSCVNNLGRQYKQSKDGVISVIFHAQHNNSKARGHVPPIYTKKEFRQWILSQNLFHELYDKWVESNYDRNIKPSVDRIDNNQPYTMDNIQLMTWGENSLKHHNDVFNGISSRRSRAILQYDLDGNLIKEYYSISKASRDTGILCGAIGNVLRGWGHTSGGFKWKYKHE